MAKCKKNEKDSLEIYEFVVAEKNQSKIESNLFQTDVKYELVALKKGSEIHSYLIEAYSSLHHGSYTSSIKDLKKFTGAINVFELSGKLIGQIVVFNGKAKNPLDNNVLKPLTAAINLFYESKNSTSKLPECNAYSSVYTEVWEDDYKKITLASTGQILGVYFLGSKYLGAYVSYMSVPYACDQAGDSFNIIQRQASYRNFFFEDHIAYDALEPCPKAVMSQLVKTSGCQIAQVLNKLNADFSKYNVNIISGYNGNPASTIRTDAFNYKITVSNGYTTATKLFRASNLLHEMVHAYFMSLKDDLSANTAVFNDFPVLFQAFVNNKYPGSTFDAHHEEMANLYINAIGSALQEYQTGIAVAESITPDQAYIDLAWGGLKGTPVYENHFKNNAIEKARVENRYNCEGTGTTKGNQIPLGKPCN